MYFYETWKVALCGHGKHIHAKEIRQVRTFVVKGSTLTYFQKVSDFISI